MLGHWICFVFSVVGRERGLPRYPVPKDLKRFIDGSGPEDYRGANVAALGAISWKDIELQDWIETVNRFGKRSPLRSWWNSPSGSLELLEVIMKMLSQSPGRPGVVRVLALLPAWESSPTLPREHLQIDPEAEPRFHEGALIARLKHTCWTDEDVPALTDQLANLLPAREAIALEAVEAAIEGHGDRAAIDQFLVNVLDLLPPEQWAAKAAIIKALDESTARIQTRLTQRAVWTDLGLPAGLPAR